MLLHLLKPRAPKIRLAWNALHGSFGMQLVGEPRHVDEVLAIELVDSDRVDVAPGSNVVGVDDQLDWWVRCHVKTIAQSSGDRIGAKGTRWRKLSEIEEWFNGKKRAGKS
jgi:hypothetical protein